jgi:hypothetical protein
MLGDINLAQLSTSLLKAVRSGLWQTQEFVEASASRKVTIFFKQI